MSVKKKTSSQQKHSYSIRKAVMKDAPAIYQLINAFANKNTMLPRSYNEIYEFIRDFFVCLSNKTIVAVCALHTVWEDIAEIRSVAVSKRYQKKGLGKKLIKQCLKEAKSLGIKKVFVLTYHPEFFRELGFYDIEKDKLPHKIWSDCLKCPKFPNCREVALIKDINL
jgi:amino-acid N-acetyltransferase